MVNELCSRRNNCFKINILEDKNLPDILLSTYITEICRICQERSEQNDTPGLYEARERLARFCHQKDIERGMDNMTPSFDACPP